MINLKNLKLLLFLIYELFCTDPIIYDKILYKNLSLIYDKIFYKNVFFLLTLAFVYNFYKSWLIDNKYEENTHENNKKKKKELQIVTKNTVKYTTCIFAFKGYFLFFIEFLIIKKTKRENCKFSEHLKKLIFKSIFPIIDISLRSFVISKLGQFI